MSSVEIGSIAEITLRTLWVCGSALVIALTLGIPIGIALGARRFAGRGMLVSAVNAGMGAPPVVPSLCRVSPLPNRVSSPVGSGATSGPAWGTKVDVSSAATATVPSADGEVASVDASPGGGTRKR